MIVDTVLLWNQIVICGRVSLQHIQMTIIIIIITKCQWLFFEVSDPALAAMGYDQSADVWSLGVVLWHVWMNHDVPVLLVRWHNWTWMCAEKDLWMSANLFVTFSNTPLSKETLILWFHMPTFSNPKRAFMLPVSHDLIETLLWMNPGMSCPLFATSSMVPVARELLSQKLVTISIFPLLFVFVFFFRSDSECNQAAQSVH